MSIKYYNNKIDALEYLNTLPDGGIVCNRNIKKYFVLQNYKSFLNAINRSHRKDFYEFIPSNKPVCFYYDIEIYKRDDTNDDKNDDKNDDTNIDTNDDKNDDINIDTNIINTNIDYYINYKIIVETCIEKVYNLVKIEFPNVTMKQIILESHSDKKRSFHIILRFFDDDVEIVFEDVNYLKNLYKRFKLDLFRDSENKYIIDPSVYREGLFRTLYSSKHQENRPMIKSVLSDPFEDIESFVCYFSERTIIFKDTVEDITGDVIIDDNKITNNYDNIVNIPEELNNDDKMSIKRFIQKEFHHLPNKIRDVFIDKEHNRIIISLMERYCPFLDKEHRGNNQYIIIDTYSAKQKCHNTECNEDKYNEIRLENYPREINEIIKKCLKVNQQELDLIDHAIVECKNYINENFDKDVKDVKFDRKEMIFRTNVLDKSLVGILKGKCPECNVEHQISDNGYCLKCKICLAVFPKNQIIPLDNRYKNLNSFWMNYSQLVNHGTINNIINIYNGEQDFSCDIKLDDSIFKNKEITSIINQVLDGHKITMISKLLFTINKDFVYSRNDWYYFTGAIWRCDNDNIEMKKCIIDLSILFDKIKTHYENKESGQVEALNKNIKNLINKFHKPGYQDDIIKGAKIYNNDSHFFYNLNSKKHLVPFTNGVFDLIENNFRKTKKDDYINFTVNYDYSATKNPEVVLFLEQVLPNPNIRDYVLKKMSECLNGDIPNTYFLMFIGDTGANGKSQLLNLMKLAMGDFGEKVEVTLLTRKRNNANEANTEKIKLMNKRFAFLSEPEDGEKINIGLLKELTGSEEIVARGLYQEAMSFVMEAKLFLACNELPEIKGEDTALWRRIRVIDFPSRFVDDPKEPGEYKIDRTLPSRMREDITWRQTFMKILLEYYYKDVKEPIEVQIKTNEYRQDNNDLYNWLEENLECKVNTVLQVKDVVQLYTGKSKVHSSAASRFKKELEKYIKEKYKHLKWEYGIIRVSDKTYKGWKDICLKDF
jgi:P4 family phage/plasmid primase-like protien